MESKLIWKNRSVGSHMKIDLLKQLLLTVGSHILDWRKTLSPEIRYKQGKEIVSNFDLQAERLIRQGLEQLYPKIPIWGEELGGQSNAQEFILIDAIDGSKNYLAGLPEFASQICLIRNNQVEWSMINLPELHQLYWAARGQGAWCNDNKITPSTQGNLDLAIQCFGIGHEAADYISLAQLLGSNLAEPRHFGSAGVHYAYLASGKIDIYIAKEAALYDFAPGFLLCQEAGLESSDLRGNPIDFNLSNQGTVLANTRLIEQYKKMISTKG